MSSGKACRQCRSQPAQWDKWRARPRQLPHLERRSAHQNSLAAVRETQLRHREHDDSQQRRQQFCDSASVQDPGVLIFVFHCLQRLHVAVCCEVLGGSVGVGNNGKH